MMVGHYATALVAKKQQPGLPLWACLLAAMSLDFVMVALVLGGVEQMEPANPEAPKLHEMAIDMTYSHDLVPVALWVLLAATVTYAVSRSVSGAAWIGGLVAFHEISDLVSGWHHFVFGPDSARVGLGLYSTGPTVAVGVELALSLGCAWWFLRGTNASRRLQIGIYAAMILGCAALLPYAL